MKQNQDIVDMEAPVLEPDAALLSYCEKLYPLTFSLKQHKLWKTIHEYEPYAVTLPDGSSACCVLIEMDGSFISLSVYYGENGWNNIRKLWEAPNQTEYTEEQYQELMMSQCYLQIVFCCKDDLAAAEIESLRRYAKENGITFRGKNAYFCFRNVKPYHATWFLETEAQADILEAALRGTLDLAAQLEQGKTKFELGLLPYTTTLPRYVPTADHAVWDTMEMPGETEIALTTPKLDEAMQQKLRRMKKSGGKWECQLYPFPEPVRAKEGAPFFPFLMLILDTKRDQLLQQQPLQYSESILQEALDGFVQAVIDYGRCPKSIAVCDKRTETILSDMCRSCGILLLRTTRFAMLDEAKESFLDDLDSSDEDTSLEEVVELLEQIPDEKLVKLPEDIIRQLLEEDIPAKLRKRLEKTLEAKGTHE